MHAFVDRSIGVIGVKRAAQRKLQHELGIAAEEVPLESFNFVTRIHYLAHSDETWGEHEVDYVLFVQKDVKVSPNENEVSAVRYVSQRELSELVESEKRGEVKLTPWFALINDTFLKSWWDSLLSNDFSPSSPLLLHQRVIHRLSSSTTTPASN